MLIKIIKIIKILLYNIRKMAGTLDTTFNNPNGFITKQFTPKKYTAGFSIAIDSSGRAIVTGDTKDNTDTLSMFIARYLKNGNLDMSFNSPNGYITKQYTSGKDTIGRSIAIDSSGRILVTGYTDSDMFITRYLTNGTVDTAFGDSGVIFKNYTPEYSTTGLSITIDTSGRILVSGKTKSGMTSSGDSIVNMFVTRYLSDGTLDTTFGDGGVVIEKRITDNTVFLNTSLAIDSTGKIAVFIAILDENNTRLNIFRYLINGVPDTSFAKDGVINDIYGGKATYGLSITIDSSDRILVTGTVGVDMFISRYLTNGTLDTTFGDGGVSINLILADGYSIAIDSSGRILVTGRTFDENDSMYMFITRYLSNGAIDTTFGDGGFSIKQFIPGINITGNSLAIDSNDNDNILVTGGGFDLTSDKGYMFVAKYLSGDSTTTTTTTHREPICLVAGTPILTDQGLVAIEKIDTKKHTISKKRIVAITTTITPEKHLVCFEANSMGINCPTVRTVMTPGHEVLYNGKLVQAKHFVGRVEGVHTVPYNGRDVLYNVLMEKHGLMRVNNMILETLHPANKVAKRILRIMNNTL
jgi:uncharacterized delta-60 repeat protein